MNTAIGLCGFNQDILTNTYEFQTETYGPKGQLPGPPSKHETLNQCWFNVGPTSGGRTLNQHWFNANIEPTSVQCPVFAKRGPACFLKAGTLGMHSRVKNIYIKTEGVINLMTYSYNQPFNYLLKVTHHSQHSQFLLCSRGVRIS